MAESFAILTVYLIGSIPFGYLIVKWAKGIDIRSQGSGNIGMTNVWRVAGAGWGITTLLLDIAKGVFAVQLPSRLWPENEFFIILCALTGLLGNIFPVFLRFKGGKGIGISVGIFFSLLPLESSAGVAIFLIALALTRMVSLGSLLGATTMALLAVSRLHLTWITGLAAVAAVMIWWTHRQNIKRILNGTENKIGKARKQKP